MSLSQVDVELSKRPLGWKILMSLWVIPVFAGLGMVSFIGWIWAGYVAQSRRMWRWAVIWTALNLLVWVLALIAPSNPHAAGFLEPWKTYFQIGIFSVWITGAAAALFLIGPVLKDRVRYHARLAAFGAPGTTPEVDLGPPPLEPVDINSATAETISSVPGVVPDTAESIMRVRRSKGGFVDLADLVASVPMSTEQADALAGWIEFGPFDTPGPWQHRGPVDL